MADNVSGAGNVAVGDSAGAGVEGDFNIYIGAFAGPSAAGPISESETIRIGDAFNTGCFVGGISGVPSSGNPVCVDGNGQLGECGAASPMSANEFQTARRCAGIEGHNGKTSGSDRFAGRAN